MKREVLEEVGLEIEDEISFLKDFTFVRPDDLNVVGLCFAVKAKSDDVKIDAHDFEDYAWVSPEELSQYDHIEGMGEEVSLAFKK